MDPNKTLNELVALAEEVSSQDYATNEQGERMAELFLYLHKWMARGGAIPDAWMLRREAK